MDRCAINFIARHWWRRVEVWVIALLLVAGGSILGYQAGVWSASSEQTKQLAEVRAAYDAALGKRDLRLTNLAEKTQDAAVKVQEASNTAVQAADAAAKAADKADEALSRAAQ
jgi:predicted negative regulator of RcsB-dependent stress response